MSHAQVLYIAAMQLCMPKGLRSTNGIAIQYHFLRRSAHDERGGEKLSSGRHQTDCRSKGRQKDKCTVHDQGLTEMTRLVLANGEVINS